MRRADRDPRKAPKRAHSKDTVGFLLDAVGKVLSEEGGIDAFKVTRVAKVAGVGIGTVYQYFPTKEALLTAWEERIGTRALERFQSLVLELDSRNAAMREVVPRFIAVLFEMFQEIGKLGPQAARRPEHWTGLAKPAVALLSERLNVRSKEVALLPKNLIEASRVIVICVAACAEWAGHRRDIDVDAFQEEVARMIVNFLVGPPASA